MRAREGVQAQLQRLGGGDAVIVGSNLWDEGAGGWYLGGEQRLLRAWARLLASRGFRVHVVTPVAAWRQWDHEGCHWVGVPPLRSSGFNRAVWNWRLHRLLPAQTKVLYSYAENASPRCVPGSLILQHAVSWDGASPKRQTRAMRQSRGVLASCGAVLCVDTNFPNVMAAGLRDLGELHAKCHYLPNFAEVRPAAPAEPGPGPVRVLYVKRFGAEQGTHLMIEAARRLWDEGLVFELEIVGYSPSGVWEARIKERLAPELGSGRCLLHVLGFEEVGQAYARGAFTLVPTCKSEGTSLSCLEAMAHGLPVISTWIGGLPDLVQHEWNGLLIAPRLEDLVAAMRRLVEDPGLRARLSAGAFETGRRFSEEVWQRNVHGLLDALGWSPPAS